MKKKTKVKKQRKVVTKPRKVTSKDLDEWAKSFEGAKYLLKFGSKKIGYLDPSEFDGVVE